MSGPKELHSGIQVEKSTIVQTPTNAISAFLLQICSIFSVINNSSTFRPRINCIVGGVSTSWLFDTGAARTCMGIEHFRSLFPKGLRPKIVPSDMKLSDAGGNDLGCLGKAIIPFSILGRQFEHHVVILQNLKDLILGIDLMHDNGLSYLAHEKRFLWGHNENVSPISDHLGPWTTATIALSAEVSIQPFTSIKAKVFSITDSGYHIKENENVVCYIQTNDSPCITAPPSLITFNSFQRATIILQNTSPHHIYLAKNTKVGLIENISEDNEPVLLSKDFISQLSDSVAESPKISPKAKNAFILKNVNLNVPAEYKSEYLNLLYKYGDIFSDSKMDLGITDAFFHKIHLKSDDPIYRKQFKIPDSHREFLQNQVTDWLKLGIVSRTNSLYNSPVFCVPKKDGSLRIVQDFRQLNLNSKIDKYSMKEIHECIGDIGRAGSTIFSTLDMTAGFWQMPLHPDS